MILQRAPVACVKRAILPLQQQRYPWHRVQPHALLQQQLAENAGSTVPLGPKLKRLVQDHAVDPKVVVPAVMFVEMAAAAVHRTKHQTELKNVILEDLAIELPLVFPDAAPEVAQTMMECRFEEEDKFVICNYDVSDPKERTVHVRGTVRSQRGSLPDQASTLQAAAQRCTHPVHVSALYDTQAGLGLMYGPEFRAGGD